MYHITSDSEVEDKILYSNGVNMCQMMRNRSFFSSTLLSLTFLLVDCDTDDDSLERTSTSM